MDALFDVFLDALTDTAKMIPLLLVIYVLIEIIEVKFGDKTNKAVAKAGKAGPLVGALAGVIPQCGVSVVGTALYTQRLATIGTLFAVYLATSDEAIPIILSQPGSVGVLIPLIAIKLIVAIVAGYALDLAFRKRNVRVFNHIHDESDAQIEEAVREDVHSEKGCCGHELAGESEKLTVRTVLVHPLIHTLKIFAFIFLTSFVIGALFTFVGESNIAAALSGHPFVQLAVSALIGLIPNCAASVAITEFYLSHVITFGAAIAGLCASGGLGILVLLKDDTLSEALKIIAGLFVISLFAGTVVYLLGI